MEWYWQVGLSRISGAAGWDEREMYFHTILEAKSPFDKSKQLFHPSTEAFLVLLWENSRDRWVAAFKHDDDHPEDKNPDRTAKNKHLPMFNSKYTTQDGGQQKFGGWKAAGIKRFNELHTMIKDIREKPEFKEFEKNFLAHLRLKHGYTARDM